MKEKIENFNVEFDATLVDIMGLLYFGSMTIKEWAEDLAIEIREDMDFRSLREKECEISRKTFVVENNLFLAKSAVRVAEASKARSYGASYSEIANQASAGRRKTAASIESEVEAKIEAASDRLIYSQILCIILLKISF